MRLELRPRVRLVSLFLACSLLSVGCGKGIRVTTCVSDPGGGGFQCVDPDGKVNFIAFAATGNYVCFSPTDARTLLEACAVKGSDLVAHVKEDPRLERAVLAKAATRRLYQDLARGEATQVSKPKEQPSIFLGDTYPKPKTRDYNYE